MPFQTNPQMQLQSHADIVDIRAAFELVAPHLRRVEKLIKHELAQFPNNSEISRLLATYTNQTGKMLRPALLLLSAGACGKISDRHIYIAAVLQIIHNATLFHDDVIDEGKIRRGRPTLNSVSGNEAAVLFGDLLFSRAFTMCATLQPQLTKIIAATTVRLCRGELSQASQKQNPWLTESDYIDIITEKCASLFSCCCLLGAHLADAPQSNCRALSRYGLNAGIAFQITDDLLDIIGDETKTGKTLGTDIAKNTLTLPAIHFLNTAPPAEKNNAKTKLYSVAANKQALAVLLKNSGSLEYTRKKTQHFISLAIQSLEALPQNDARNALVEITRFIAGRAG